MPVPKTPLLTTDCVVVDARGRVLLVRRGKPPFKGKQALPGGFVNIGETVEDACRRELLGVYSDPKRDPRGHTCAVVFLTRIARATPKGGDDAAAARWVENWSKLDLAFDHARILEDAKRKLRRG
jgi:8-oxo-dGTP diphosphatase